MKRKTFLKTTIGGMGLNLIPSLHQRIENLPAGTSPKLIKEGQGDVYNVWGDLQTHKLTGKDTDGKFFEWYSDVEPGVGIPPHYHTNEDEIFRVIQGEVEFMIDGGMQIASAGDLVYAPKLVPHAWKVIGSDKVKMIVSVYPAGLEHMFIWMATLPAGPPAQETISKMKDEFGIHFV